MATATTDGRGLDPACYTSAEFYAREVEHIFRRQWICIGRLDEVAAPGDYLSLELLGEPLAMVRDAGGTVRVLSRVCRHRAMPLLDGRGNTDSIVCPYHAWTYGLDGRLAGAPEMARTPGFRAADCRLPELRSEVWQGFVFVNFDDEAAPLGPSLAGLDRLVANYRLAEMRAVRGMPFDMGCPWNWKLMCDNFMEPYHHIGAHAKTLEAIMPGRLAETLESDGPWSAVRMPYRAGRSALRSGVNETTGLPALPGLEAAERDSLTLIQVYPASLIALYGDHMEFYRLFPLGPAEFKLEKLFCVPPETAARATFEAEMDRLVDLFVSFRDEDIDICRAVQRGLSSRYAQPGILSHLEATIGRFAHYVAAQVGAPAPGP